MKRERIRRKNKKGGAEKRTLCVQYHWCTNVLRFQEKKLLCKHLVKMLLIAAQYSHYSNPRLSACNLVHFQQKTVFHRWVKNQGLRMPFQFPHEEFCKHVMMGIHKLLYMACPPFQPLQRSFWKDEPVEDMRKKYSNCQQSNT